MKSVVEWMDIERTPQHGKYVLIRCGDGSVTVGYWNVDCRCWTNSRGIGLDHGFLRYYAELPTIIEPELPTPPNPETGTKEYDLYINLMHRVSGLENRANGAASREVVLRASKISDLEARIVTLETRTMTTRSNLEQLTKNLHCV